MRRELHGVELRDLGLRRLADFTLADQTFGLGPANPGSRGSPR
jgi:hypothetical protein